jgi:hypothetical protein
MTDVRTWRVAVVPANIGRAQHYIDTDGNHHEFWGSTWQSLNSTFVETLHGCGDGDPVVHSDTDGEMGHVAPATSRGTEDVPGTTPGVVDVLSASPLEGHALPDGWTRLT